MKPLFAFLVLSTSLFAQTARLDNHPKKQTKVQSYFAKLEKENQFITECEAKTRESQIKEFGRILPKTAGECEWSSNGCPVSLVKPVFPESAENFTIPGSVEVEIIINKAGKVVYSKAIKGQRIFYPNAERAALLSRFQPLTLCGKPVWHKKTIRYNFISN